MEGASCDVRRVSASSTERHRIGAAHASNSHWHRRHRVLRRGIGHPILIGTLVFLPVALAIAGTVSMLAAVYNERRMHRHRQPGVTYRQATLRRDGGWRRTDLFTEQGLAHQRRASRFGVTGAALWLLALAVLFLSG